MNRGLWTPITLAGYVGAIVACGDNAPEPPPCRAGFYDRYCRNAVTLAARGESELLISSERTHLIYQLLRPALVEHPILRAANADPGFFGNWWSYSIRTTNAAIGQAWMLGETIVGDDQIDVLLATENLEMVRYYNADYFGVFYRDPVNFRVLREHAGQIETTAVTDSPYEGMDPGWAGINIEVEELADGTSLVDWHVGWDDCDLGCLETHAYQTVHRDDELVDFRDLGGGAPPQSLIDFYTHQEMPPR